MNHATLRRIAQEIGCKPDVLYDLRKLHPDTFPSPIFEVPDVTLVYQVSSVIGWYRWYRSGTPQRKRDSMARARLVKNARAKRRREGME